MVDIFEGEYPAPYGMLDFMRDFEDEFVERAKFAGKYQDDPALLGELESAARFNWTKSVDQWVYETEGYPYEPISVERSERYKYKKRLTRLTGKEAAVRAYVLNLALARLLRIVGAPDTMVKDLDLILSDFAPVPAEAAAKVQKAIIDDPRRAENITKLAEAEDVQVHRGTVHKMFARGTVKRPE
jgi:hypothetical protein